MQTEIITVTRGTLDEARIRPVAEGIRNGKIVVFPTETVYGIGCRHDDESAKERIFLLKKRERSKPLALYVLTAAELGEHAVVTPAAEKLAEAFLPGPLTLVLRGRHGGKVGFRVPSDAVARRLMHLCEIPLSGTSANLSGHDSPTNGQQAIAAMKGKTEFILDAGQTEFACESTVIDLSAELPVVLREGAISLDALSRVLGCEVQKAF